MSLLLQNEGVLGKVTALVTRETSQGRELLVFQHPTAGVQLPAGTIEPDETPAAAVLREVTEETGLVRVELVRPLAILTMLDHEKPLEADEYLLLRTTSRMRYPGESNVPSWRVVRRSERVRLLEVQDSYAHVRLQQYKLLENGEFVVNRCVDGWVEADALTQRVERHLFHLRVTDSDIPDIWEKSADLQHHFRLCWVPLTRDPNLVKGQRDWLTRVRHQLLS